MMLEDNSMHLNNNMDNKMANIKLAHMAQLPLIKLHHTLDLTLHIKLDLLEDSLLNMVLVLEEQPIHIVLELVLPNMELEMVQHHTVVLEVAPLHMEQEMEQHHTVVLEVVQHLMV